MAYGGKQPSIDHFKTYLEIITRETTTSTQKSKQGVEIVANDTGNTSSHDCFVDGSWMYGWQAGIGMILTKGDELLVYKSKAVEACCPQQAESMALKEAVQMAIERGIQDCCFYSDCKNLVDLISNAQPPLEADWRAYHEVHETWQLMKKHNGFSCKHVNRSHNELADLLAKSGRIHGWDSIGFTYPMFRDA